MIRYWRERRFRILIPSIPPKRMLNEYIGLKSTVDQGLLAGTAARRREARSNQASAVCLSYISRMTIVENFDFLFRLRHPRNHRSNLIEYLVPALHLTAFFRALHGFISNEGKFRLAVSEILKEGHVVRAVYRLVFYS